MSMSWIILCKSIHAQVGIRVGADQFKAVLGLFHQKAERVNIQVLPPNIVFLRLYHGRQCKSNAFSREILFSIHLTYEAEAWRM